MNMRIDPVCGMAVDPATAAVKFDYEGETYYFCHPICLRKFSADPQSYLNRAPQPAAMGRPVVQLGGKSGSQRVMATAQPQTETLIVREDDEYTCPMDPDVVQTGPGACPKCGMALEPMTPAFPATKTEYVCPMHPQIVPDLRNGARAARGHAGGRREPRTERHEAPVLGERGVDAAGLVPGDVGDDSRAADPACSLAAIAHVHSIRAGHAGRVVGRMAVLRARMGFDRQSQPEYVHADRNRHGRGVALQRHCDIPSGHLPRVVSRPWRRSGGLFRGRGGDHDSGSARTGVGVARAQPDEQRD